MTAIIHVITGLQVGGAELALYRLLTHQSNGDYKHEVVALSPGGAVGSMLRDAGVPLLELDLKRRPLRSLVALWRLVRARPGSIVQTWMYHADIVGGAVARIAGNRRVIWGIRCTDPPAGLSGGRFVLRAARWMSHFVPARIACCAVSARDFHAAAGFDASRMVVVPNGCDIPSTPERARVDEWRERHGVESGALVVGMVSRFDYQKDFGTFFRTAAKVLVRRPGVRFLLVGRGLVPESRLVARWLSESGADPRAFVFCGQQMDMPLVYAAMDVLCSTSRGGEAFPNVICEAMASGLPCVVTDVGDAARIVGDAGFAVPIRDADAIATALLVMLELPRRERALRGEQARMRVIQNFSMDAMTRNFESLYEEVASGVSKGAARCAA
jgi:glycosyltransferase involved in cell wall biosynthesis